jgi:hypothetical protein
MPFLTNNQTKVGVGLWTKDGFEVLNQS